ncbi:MAG: hypothetical protein ACQEQM_01930 [Thermoplasmatota archaeon]
MVCDVKEPVDLEDDVKKEVVNHLIFHKSLIDENRSGERINDYLEMVDGMNGEYHISNDPFENAIASIFKLVIDENLDPWNIDLVSFTTMYLEQAQNKETIDFIVAGQLVNMAWSILKMQCEETLLSAENGEEEEFVQDEFISQWECFDYDMYDEPEDLDYEQEVLQDDEPILEKAVRREEKKPVSLIQLVDAFEEARKESKYREKMERLRKENKQQREEERARVKENYDTKAHKEDIYHDIALTWERICWYQTDELTFDMIHDNRLRDLVTTLVSVLFLNNKKKIKVEQEFYPDGPINIENLVPEEEREEGLLKYISEKDEEGLTLEQLATI